VNGLTAAFGAARRQLTHHVHSGAKFAAARSVRNSCIGFATGFEVERFIEKHFSDIVVIVARCQVDSPQEESSFCAKRIHAIEPCHDSLKQRKNSQ